MTLEPVIKWSGSKRSQAAEIVRRFPREIDTYYEPFCGGASVLRRLLMTPSVKVRRYVCSDKNWDLIGLWNEIKFAPDWLSERYAILLSNLNQDDDLDRKKKFFMEVIKQMAISVSEMKRPNSRLIEFAQNWKRECDINGIADICYADKRQNDLRLTPQFNTERRISDGRRRRR